MIGTASDPFARRRPVRLGVGIIGAGAISSSHAAAYLSAGQRVRLISVADIDLDRARSMRERFCVDDAVADHRELLERADIDVVSVCTPAGTHAQIVLDAIRAGKHVLCEKPLTTNLENADMIISAASKRPMLRVSCVFQHRDDPALRRARWILDRELIGRVSAASITAHARRTASYYGEARGQWQTDGGGALMVQGIHLLDAMLWLLGDAQSVSATMGTLMHDVETEDTIAGWARLANGVLATVDSTTCAHRDEYSIDILGHEASLHLRYRPGWARMWHLDVQSRRPWSARAIRWRAERRIPPASRMRALHVAHLAAARIMGSDRQPRHLGHGPHIRRFLDAVECGGRPPVPPSEAFRSVELALALYRSESIGEVVKLPLTEQGPTR